MPPELDLESLRKAALQSKKKHNDESEKEDGEISEEEVKSVTTVEEPPEKSPSEEEEISTVNAQQPQQQQQQPVFPSPPFPFPFPAPFLFPPGFMFDPNRMPFFPPIPPMGAAPPSLVPTLVNSMNSFSQPPPNLPKHPRGARPMKRVASRQHVSQSSSSSVNSASSKSSAFSHDSSDEREHERTQSTLTSIQTNTDLAKECSNYEEAKSATQDIVDAGIGFQEFLKEGIHPIAVRHLFSQLGINIPVSENEKNEEKVLEEPHQPASTATHTSVSTPSVSAPTTATISSSSSTSSSVSFTADNAAPSPKRRRTVSPTPPLTRRKPFGRGVGTVIIELDSDSSDDESTGVPPTPSTVTSSQISKSSTGPKSATLNILRKKEEEIKRMTLLIMKLEASKKTKLGKKKTPPPLAATPTIAITETSNAKPLESESLEETESIASVSVPTPVDAEPDSSVEPMTAPWTRETFSDESTVEPSESASTSEKSESPVVVEKDELELAKEELSELERDHERLNGDIVHLNITLEKTRIELKQNAAKQAALLRRITELSSERLRAQQQEQLKSQQSKKKEAPIDTNTQSVAPTPETQPSNTVQDATTHDAAALSSSKPPVYITPFTMLKCFRFHPQYAQVVKGGIRSLTYSNKIDPLKPLCKYETSGGICNDESCGDAHFADLGMTDEEILKDLEKCEELILPDKLASYREEMSAIVNKEQKINDAATSSDVLNSVSNKLAATYQKWVRPI
ncbi:hypothetical protein SJAG_04768 [Schizosaccharomyces japonicus yFS275]|uniref:Putative zinc-finger domain-containing protein n=1 Tax=Schizosaccharomyces japonicus (strain yFS275 / FY16936) TaxID=402676 RepID=B6K7Q2_SCHJY|nr:hypothetical protein SJAG_04768 [Schizosaccharomyces japonicus yFS275]EEB09556.1 hypothetical protein SJAG_04768 [Schizosaccharomyces japonicus yFS275]